MALLRVFLCITVFCFFYSPVCTFSEEAANDDEDTVSYDVVPPQGVQDSVIVQDDETGEYEVDQVQDPEEETDEYLDDGVLQK